MINGKGLPPIKLYQPIVLVDQRNKVQIYNIFQCWGRCITFLSSCLQNIMVIYSTMLHMCVFSDLLPAML
jgi:hypothetical protein